ncbi:MAG: cytochrome c3 family protein, partial [Actinobacteria bacterium]|nr:cytochrome c3 family protein [Actinomycetota bacterium]MCG2807697.1 cytochrome c3 family protein [Coriobacteriia bacterium]
FERTAHFQGPGRTDVIDSTIDFNTGTTFNNLVYTDGSLRLRDDLSIAEGLPATITPASWTGWTGGGAFITTWLNAEWRHPESATPQMYWVTTSVDLGAPTNVTAARLLTGYQSYNRMAQVIRVYTSDDGVTWTFRGETGSQGVNNADIVHSFPIVAVRYVRVEAGAWWPGSGATGDIGFEIRLNKLEVHGAAPSGTWTSPVRDISQQGTATSALVDWSQSNPASAEQTVSASVSLDGGTSWSAYARVTNGGTVPGLVGNDISSARVRYRVEMARGSASENQYLYGISTKITAGSANAAVSYPGSGAAPGSCANCHDPHGTSGSAGVRAVGNALCFACHDAVGITRAADYAYTGRATYEASAHGPQSCTGCHAPHGYNDNPPNGMSSDSMLAGSSNFSLCLRCHDSAVNSASGTDIAQRFTMGSSNTTKHNVNPADWLRDGTRVDCTNCHAPHSGTADQPVIDPDTQQPYIGATIADPSTTGITLAPDKDTGIFEQNPGSNNGAGGTTVMGALNTGSGPTNRRSLLLHFPMGSVPSTWTISSARLRMYTADYVPQMLAYKVSPLTQAFDEGAGTGSGDLASVVGGASWNERIYGDGLWTGAGMGDWLAPGGDYEAATVGSHTTNGMLIDIECLNVINRMRQTGNQGLIVYVDGDAFETLSSLFTSEGLWSPRLELTFSGVPSRTVADSQTLCLSCHDGAAPQGVLMGALPALKGWTTNGHGGGIGASGDGGGYDLPSRIRPPFSYNSPPMACGTCHDPHGSSAVYHLTSIDGKTEYSIAANGTGAQVFCSQCHEMPLHATPTAASYGYDHPGWKECFGCHKHGSNF